MFLAKLMNSRLNHTKDNRALWNLREFETLTLEFGLET